jgi:hypothetical protein
MNALHTLDVIGSAHADRLRRPWPNDARLAYTQASCAGFRRGLIAGMAATALLGAGIALILLHAGVLP